MHASTREFLKIGRCECVTGVFWSTGSFTGRYWIPRTTSFSLDWIVDINYCSTQLSPGLVCGVTSPWVLGLLVLLLECYLDLIELLVEKGSLRICEYYWCFC